MNGDTHLIVAILDFNFFVKNLTWAVQVNLGSRITPRYRTSVLGFTFDDPIQICGSLSQWVFLVQGQRAFTR